MTVPSTSAPMTLGGAIFRPLPGRSTPAALRTAIRTKVSATPTSRPSAEPSRPMTMPSQRSVRLICFGVAPIAESTASSRRRWATMTLNVL